MRLAMVRTSRAPSGWRNAPATPHMSASHSLSVDECVEDADVRITLIWPAQLVLDPEASGAAHCLALGAIVEQLHYCRCICRDIAAVDIARRLPGRYPGFLKVE